jgi:hypothetical protein
MLNNLEVLLPKSAMFFDSEDIILGVSCPGAIMFSVCFIYSTTAGELIIEKSISIITPYS